MNRIPLTSLVDSSAIVRETFIRHVEFHPRLESTNLTALQLLAPLIQSGPSLVLTAEQTAGRGRKGNIWWSSAGALTFSVVINPAMLRLPHERRPLISLISGLAARDAVSSFLPGQRVQIKWPNDVYISQQKLCGILAEQHPVPEGGHGLIIGIGINVNNSLEEAPADIRQRAVSMFDLNHHSFDLTAVLIAVLQQLERRSNQLVTHPMQLLAEANSCHLLNQRQITVTQNETLLTGQCAGIDDEGNLVLVQPDQVLRLSSGVVTAWKTG